MYISIKPDFFLYEYKNNINKYNVNNQNDSLEYLRLLVEDLSKELNRINNLKIMKILITKII